MFNLIGTNLKSMVGLADNSIVVVVDGVFGMFQGLIVKTLVSPVNAQTPNLTTFQYRPWYTLQ